MIKANLIKITALFLTAALVGCSGAQTFQSNLRAGDTAAVAAGWKHNFSRDNITVTITPSIGAPITYLPNDPAVRGVVNMYPDPISSMVISDATDQDITPFARTYALGTSFFTSSDKDWWQTTVFIDLPNTLPIGLANIEVTNTQGDSVAATVNIIDGAGQAEIFDVDQNGPLTKAQFSALERIDHFVVSFTGTEIPYALQLNFTHDPDVDNSGVGRAYVSNPRGDLKNIMWNDDGSNLHVVLTPTRIQSVSDMKDFKFYVSGGINNLVMNNMLAVDINGNAVLGVVLDVTAEK
jgi:hypothetical protein